MQPDTVPASLSVPAPEVVSMVTKNPESAHFGPHNFHPFFIASHGTRLGRKIRRVRKPPRTRHRCSRVPDATHRDYRPVTQQVRREGARVESDTSGCRRFSPITGSFPWIWLPLIYFNSAFSTVSIEKNSPSKENSAVRTGSQIKFSHAKAQKNTINQN